MNPIASPSLRLPAAVLSCLMLAYASGSPAAEQPIGIVAEPCPASAPPSARLLAEVTRLLIEPRTLAPEDFGRFLSDPEIIRFNEQVARRLREDWPGLCRYSAANAEVLAHSTAPRIVFIGDSITENWTLADSGFFANGVVNRGIGGQTSPQILARFRADVVVLQPAAVHILAGTNDVAGNTGPTTIQDFKNNIMSMVDIAQANGIKVILGSIPPAATFSWQPQVQPAPTIGVMNSWLRSYASRRKLTFVDYHASLVGPAGELKSDLGNDGVHPNSKGYAVMRGLVEAEMKMELRR